MWPSSWECLSPDTCVRCANLTNDTCLYNKFTCLCNYKDGDNAACVHQQILNVHKSKFNNVTDSNINISLPGTSGIATLKKNKHRPRRKRKEKYEAEYIESDYLNGSVSETTNLLPAENYLNPDITDGNEAESVLYAHTTTKDCDSDFDFDRRISDESSSSDTSSSSSSDSLTSSSCDSNQDEVTDEMQAYQIMSPNDCDSSDTSGSDSDSASADSTSASSDNSWWQEYEQLKERQFFKKADAMKDSGYVSTTSPSDSNKIDE